MGNKAGGRILRWGAFIALIVGILGIFQFLTGVEDVPELIETIDASITSVPVTATVPIVITDSPISTPNSTLITVPPTIPALVEEKHHDFSPGNIEWDVILNDPLGIVQYEDGKYSFNTNKRVFLLGMWEKEGNIGLKNFAVEVMALGPWSDQDEGEEDQGALDQGILIGWQVVDLSRPAYGFTLTSSGTCRFWSRKLDEENWFEKNPSWRPESWLPITLEELNKKAYELLLVKKDNILTGYVNGQVCGQLEMDDYQSGFIGLAALSPDMGGKSFFDDFRLYRLKDD